MGFNYSSEKLRFDAEWKKLAADYKAAGFDDEGIQAMRDFDWEAFKKRRTYENRTQPLPCEDIDDGDADSNSSLFQKFTSLAFEFDESNFGDRHGWIDAVDDQVLADKLSRLSETDKELLTLLVFDGYSQVEIAEMQGCSSVVICKKIKRIKKYLRHG